MIRSMGIAGLVLAATVAAKGGEATFGVPPSGFLPPPIYVAASDPAETPGGARLPQPRHAAEAARRPAGRQDIAARGGMSASEPISKPMSILPQPEPTRRTVEQTAVRRGGGAPSASPAAQAPIAAQERAQGAAGILSALRGSQ